MVVEGGEKGLMYEILNKQFDMISVKMKYEDLPQDGIIVIDGKKMYWYEHYKWDTVEQYKEWRKWSSEKLKHLGESNMIYILNYADLRYGFIVRYRKQGELF